MTTFPNSPRVLKGALVGIDTDIPIPSVIVFQYNPDTLTRSLKPRSPGGEGARSEAQRLTGPPEETIKVDVEIDATRVPRARGALAIAAALGVDALALALGGGEDYELAFTTRAGVRPPVPATRIGRVARGRGIVRVIGAPIAARGFDHFG